MEALLSVIQLPLVRLVRYCSVNTGLFVGHNRLTCPAGAAHVSVAPNIMPFAGRAMLLMRTSSIKPRKFALDVRPGMLPRAKTVGATGRSLAMMEAPMALAHIRLVSNKVQYNVMLFPVFASPL